ncbi:MAG: hypothetical protein EB035_07705, partial [Actinobacteria bacterium]|nr:hypothetical protein [Actinomycetota bacterium]
MNAEQLPEQNVSSSQSESTWTRGITAMMLAAIAMSTVVLGVVAIVAMTKSDSTTSSSTELPTTISVDLTEFKINMSASAVKPGDITFQVKNNGNVAHNFAIPLLKFKTEMLNPGQSVTLVASDVAAGTYEIRCEVSGHLEAGMKASLTVSPDAPS